ncbi:MAG TPA: PQQ-dependent dehydrogenase, methanol/ethanol family, partial [Rhodopila sp.]|nr:PQQ-dependent dehydrogenase, methanol/ethanol family [Rhodopila sp.]
MKRIASRHVAAGTVLSSLLMMGSPHAQTPSGDDLLRMEKNAANVVMPTNTYDNQRYSGLDQINASNVGKLQVAWTFSTGVLRGHEGGPLVVGDVMYFDTPFPNAVYALDLNHDGRILW